MTSTAPSPAKGPSEPLGRTTSGDVVPTAAERSRPPWLGSDRLLGWVGPLVITVLAFFLRVWNLGTPHQFSFDETYYAKDAWSLLHFGYVRNYTDEANDQILAGSTLGHFKDDPSMIVHPEVGKWLIALGEQAFGMDPFGWRISAAVIGSLMILVLCRLVRRLTGSTLLGCVAGLLLCFDGLHLTLSRMGLLDIFLTFWLVCAVACLVADRDWTRRRLAVLTAQRPVAPGGWGPVRAMLWHPWLLAAGVFFGLGVGTKWTALYPLAAFGMLVWAWHAGARRTFGVRGAWWRSALADGITAFVHLVVVAFVVYLISWTGWLMHAGQYEEHLSATQYTQFSGTKGCETQSNNTDAKWPTATEPDASGPGEVVQSLRSLYYYHRDVLTFHTYFLDCSTHTYESKPRGWLLLNRPVGADAQLDIQPGTQGCGAPQGSDCIRQVLILGTPVLWWGGALALLFAVFAFLGRRDWRYGLVLVGVASTWLPWFLYDDRPIFLFYAMPILPFTVIALSLVMGRLVTAPVGSLRRLLGVIAAGSFFVLVLVNFVWFWPIWTDGLLTHSEWLNRIWFKRWI